MGYVHDTQMAMFIPPNLAMTSAGTWTEKETAVADVWCIERTAANATFNVRIPILLPSNAAALKGAKLVSVEIFFIILTEAMDSLAATIYQSVLNADGSAPAAGVSVSFDYDTGHDAAGERVDVDEHKMTLTLDTPVWIDNGDNYFVELAVDGGANGVFELLGAVANYTFRV